MIYELSVCGEFIAQTRYLLGTQMTLIERIYGIFALITQNTQVETQCIASLQTARFLTISAKKM